MPPISALSSFFKMDQATRWRNLAAQLRTLNIKPVLDRGSVEPSFLPGDSQNVPANPLLTRR